MVNLPRLLLRLLLGRRLPLTQGTLRVPGLQANVRIHRDRWGIPHIEADHDHDAYFAIGFCHGQDRPFQLELFLRAVRGTLCELVGPAALPIDRLSRRIGFHRAAAEQWPKLDAEVRDMIESYAGGVAAGAAHGLPRRPHEFALLGSRPTPWTPLDSLGVVKLISFTLASNWDIELARLKVLLEDGAEALTALDPAYPSWHPVTAPPGQQAGPMVDRLSEELKMFADLFGKGGGSNNWAVSAGRTATGRPLVANDPHLDARLPPHWYLIHAAHPELVLGRCDVPRRRRRAGRSQRFRRLGHHRRTHRQHRFVPRTDRTRWPQCASGRSICTLRGARRGYRRQGRVQRR